MFEKKRCHYTYIFELFFKRMSVTVAAVIVFCISVAGDMAMEKDLRNELPLGKIILFVLAAMFVFGSIVLLYCTFKWRHTYISIRENALDYGSGKFIKKRVTIPFDKINTIDMRRNVFEKLVGTCRLKIDTGAYSNTQEKNQPEMDLVFNLSEAYNIRRYILSRGELYDNAPNAGGGFYGAGALGEPKWALHAGAGDFILYGLTSSSVQMLLWAVVVIICVLAEMSVAILDRAAETVIPFVRSILKDIERQGALDALLKIMAAYIMVSLISNMFTVLWAAVRFFDFRVARQGKNVLVRYGLFTEKNYTLQVRNIHALIIRQNLFQQIIGRCSVEAVCMGFGDEQTETALLFPIIRKKELNNTLRMVLPEYINEMQTRRRRGFGILFHAVNPTLICCAVCFAIDKVCENFTDNITLIKLGCVIVIVLVFVSGIMSYFNTTLDWNKSVVSVQSGGFRKTLYRIRTDAVQEVQIKTDPIKDMFGIGTYFVHYHGPTFNNTSVSANISGGYFEGLTKILED